MIEPKIGTWVLSSLARLIQPVAVTLGLKFFVEGVDREHKDWFRKDSLVLRVTGPAPRFEAGGQVRYKFEVMVMMTDLEKDSENGFLTPNRMGTLLALLSNVIPVYDGVVQVGCLDFDRTAPEPIRVANFGKIDPHTEVVQSAIVAKYEITL